MSHGPLRNDSSDGGDLGAFHDIDRLRPHLTTLVGNDGFRALLLRALALANAEQPSSALRAVTVNADGSLDGYELALALGRQEFLEGRVVLLAQLLGLLVAFIGPSLTLRLVGEIWPAISLAGVDIALKDNHEEEKRCGQT